MRYYPRYARCDIDETGISIIEQGKITHLPHQLIKLCQIENFSQGLYAGPTSNVKLDIEASNHTVQQKSSVERLYLVPMNPLENRPDIVEMEDMVSVIKLLGTGQFPSISTNPYQRGLRRTSDTGNFDIENWDPLIPPNVYNPLPNPLWKLLRILLIAGIVTMTTLLIIAIIYNLYN